MEGTAHMVKGKYTWMTRTYGNNGWWKKKKDWKHLIWGMWLREKIGLNKKYMCNRGSSMEDAAET